MTHLRRWLATALAGSFLVLTGCDPAVKETVQTGIITSSTSLLTAIMQAALQVVQENSTS
jgi:hypothetical protein